MIDATSPFANVLKGNLIELPTARTRAEDGPEGAAKQTRGSVQDTLQEFEAYFNTPQQADSPMLHEQDALIHDAQRLRDMISPQTPPPAVAETPDHAGPPPPHMADAPFPTMPLPLPLPGVSPFMNGVQTIFNALTAQV